MTNEDHGLFLERSYMKVLHGGLVIMMLFVILGCEAEREHPGVMQLSKQRAITIANEFAKSLGYDLAKMKASADENNSVWKSYLSSSDITRREYSNLIGKLAGRDYWAVYYRLEPERFGGDLFVFVDKRTGKIIEHLSFQ
jgi:hypothetical protein